MTDYPVRINISPVYRQKRSDDFYLVDRDAFPGRGVEYTRSDRITALEAERDALREGIEKALGRLEASLFTNAEHKQAADILRAARTTEARACPVYWT